MTALLECRDLAAGYVGKSVVRDFELTVEAGEVVALLGPNGAGKTTVLLTLAGLLPRIAGRVDLDGQPSGSGVKAARQGLVLVPDDRSLFTTLTTRENLVLAQRKGGTSVESVLEYFPQLRRRLDLAAGQLSGGEQQMLAVGRALMQQPRVLLLDELSMGLAPIIVEHLLDVVRQVALDTGAAIVLVEQHVRLALTTADRVAVLVHGQLAVSGPAGDFLDDMSLLERAYLAG